MSSRFNNNVASLVQKHAGGQMLDAVCETEMWTFSFKHVKLILRLEGQIITSQIEDLSYTPRRLLDPLRQQVRELFDLDRVSDRICSDFELSVVILQAIELISDFQESSLGEQQTTSDQGARWRADDAVSWNTLLTEASLDVNSVADTAFSILGKTPAELVAEIPSQFRVIHIESVLRPDLAARFASYQYRLKAELECESVDLLQACIPPHSTLDGRVLSTLQRDEIIEDMIRPRVTYHGTTIQNVRHIVRHGFKVPGSVVNGRKVASPRSGIAFDRGMYSSQVPSYALSFAAAGGQKTAVGMLPAMRLFVCAVIMGRTLRQGFDYYEIHGPLIDGFDSHFDGGFEYICHKEAAMLPCYVIHLDLGAEAARRAIQEVQDDAVGFERREQAKKAVHPRLANQKLAPGDRKREAERKKAAAMKWFPKGFGTAKGTSFKVEMIGEVDDDEEEYGDWQKDVHGYVRDGDAFGTIEDEEEGCYEDIDEEGRKIIVKPGLAMDMYQGARRAKGKKR